MLSRRSVVITGLGLCGCSACAADGLGTAANAAAANERTTEEQGPGYRLRFIGAQRETIMNGKLAAALDLRTLASTPHLYGIGPIEQLRREVTIIGFHSTRHRGIFTPMDSAIHIHFQTPDNSRSGHIQKLHLGDGLMLSLPQSP